ncbi:simple sugar transport system permease protein [Sedimentibacter acidaminivorans]|jgi:general nucleoside transport system permease protein|uniref:Simple sugar transport system permease protein n=1 Tax=Sedimentibacter acidaminivorans TaxID=913099 RepID=A0ABS4GEF5_9FIRM|nr:ABC transporter permease [Sedimentibacter acidaminivorans]MBP1926034.1 simple sugar transport system permease protein [Sedimentibacter acidaminivorans]
MNIFLNFLIASVLAGTPLLFGTIGEIMNEKAGHLNLGVEGMMAMGACAGFMAGFMSNNLLIALLAAFAAGMIGALIYAILTITFMADQNVTGLTLTIFGVGISNFFGEYMLVHSETNSLKLPEQITAQLSNINIPFLTDIPVIGPLLFNYNAFVYLGILTAILCGIYLNHTKLGLNVRAIGENPGAADAAGIKVTKLKYFNVMLGGGICGIGGAYCSMIINGGVWMSNSVNGMGWIAVALVIFASWSPTKAIFGSFVFGGFNILKYYFPKSIITIPNAFYDMLPFIITALVLVITSIRKSKENSQPASCGVNYFREER